MHYFPNYVHVTKPKIRKPQKPLSTAHLGTQWRIVVEAHHAAKCWTTLEVFADGKHRADAYQSLHVYCHENKILVGKTLYFERT